MESLKKDYALLTCTHEWTDAMGEGFGYVHRATLEALILRVYELEQSARNGTDVEARVAALENIGLKPLADQSGVARPLHQILTETDRRVAALERDLAQHKLDACLDRLPYVNPMFHGNPGAEATPTQRNGEKAVPPLPGHARFRHNEWGLWFNLPLPNGTQFWVMIEALDCRNQRELEECCAIAIAWADEQGDNGRIPGGYTAYGFKLAWREYYKARIAQ